jgi:prepilin-type N-terminal cleavage/methylation domain-containing protein
MSSRRPVSDSAGFTLVEVMVAILLLSIAVLGTLALADGANRSTTRTKAREGATNVARDVVEAVHAVPWAELTPSTAEARVKAIAGLADSDASKAGWQITRRETAYTVALSVCTVDDAADGFATSRDSTFCAVTGSSSKPADTNPNDYRRATLTISWTDQNGPRTLTQTTLVTNVDNGPAVATIEASSLSGQSPYLYTGTGTSIAFNVTTDQPAGNVDWFVSGTKMGAATGSATSWSFAWPIGVATRGQANGTPSCSPGGSGTLDGTYFVGAQGFATAEKSAGLRASTVALNRCSPIAPAALAAGASTAHGKPELQWEQNAEDDIAGYRVYRSVNSSGPYLQVAAGSCAGLLKKASCLDTDPTIATLAIAYHYRVYAVDRDSAGALREGDPASAATVAGNQPPTTPSVSSGGTGSTLEWPSSTDPDSGDTVDYYWVYRDGQQIGDRWDAVDHVSGGLSWTDPEPSDGPADYRVTAVDSRGNESAFSNKVTR